MIRRIGVLIPLLFILVSMSLALGSVSVPFPAVADAITRGGEEDGDVNTIIVRTVRVPRTVTAVAAGAALSLAGLLMQTVFRNALAGPGVLGVTSGAGLGVAVVLLAGVGSRMVAPVGIAAIVGAFLVLGLALAVNRVIGQPVILLVLGLLFGYAASAGTTLLMASSPAEGLQR